jgi:propanediol utilization protein
MYAAESTVAASPDKMDKESSKVLAPARRQGQTDVDLMAGSHIGGQLPTRCAGKKMKKIQMASDFA